MHKTKPWLKTKEQRELKKRILQISHERSLSHIGSCLSAVDTINAIYKIKKNDDKFVLSNGHAGIALYVVLEKNGLIKKSNIKKLYIHPDRNLKLGIYVSSGSLGQGLPIALGMAIANKKQSVYCLISDGECAEGSIWEALRIANEKQVANLKIIVNLNGWGGYDPTSPILLRKKFNGFGYEAKEVNGHDPDKIIEALRLISYDKPTVIFAITVSNQFSFLKDQDAHYYTMTSADYNQALHLLKE